MAKAVMAEAGLDLSDLEKMVATMVSKLTTIDKAADQTSQHLQGIEKSSQSASKALQGFGSVLASLGVPLGLAGLVAAGRRMLDFGAQVKESSETAQLSAETYQRLKQELTGFTGAAVAETAIQGIASALRDARNENVDAIQGFKNLGVTWEQIANPATDARSIIESLSTSFKNATDKTEFLRIGVNFFGTDFLKLVPALQQGGDALKQFGDNASVVSNKVVDDATRGRNALDQLSQRVVGLWGKDAEIINDLSDASAQYLETRQGLADLADKQNQKILHGITAPGRGVNLPGGISVTGTASGVDLGASIYDITSGISVNPARGPVDFGGANAVPKPSYIGGVRPMPKGDAVTDALISHAINAGNYSGNAGPVQKPQSLLDVQTDLAKQEATRKVTIQSQLDLLQKEEDAYRAQAAIQENLGNHLEAQGFLIQANTAKLANETLQFQKIQSATEAGFGATVLSERISGQTRLASLTEIQAKWQLKIADAIRLGRDDLASTYTTMQNLELLQADVSTYSMTPSQRLALHNAQRKSAQDIVKAQYVESITGKQGESSSYGDVGYNNPGLSEGAKDTSRINSFDPFGFNSPARISDKPLKAPTPRAVSSNDTNAAIHVPIIYAGSITGGGG